MRNKRLQQEERALKRKNAKTQHLRQAINETEFRNTLQLVKNNDFVSSRKITALILLYVIKE